MLRAPDGIGTREDGSRHRAEDGHLSSTRRYAPHVANLVAQHTGQLRLGVDVYQKPRLIIDVAAAGGEGVDGFCHR
jgi:hypothetical protein